MARGEGLQHTAIENEREFVEMSKQQNEIKNKAALQTKINEKRIEEMYKIQEKLRDKFIQVNDFMKECQEKKTRAETQILTEVEEQARLTSNIAEIQNDLDVLTEFHKKFEDSILQLQHYEDVFNDVIKDSDVESFDDLMARCDALSMS